MGAVEHVVVVSAGRANADALAACCRRRGLQTTVIAPGEALPDSDVVVLDLTGGDVGASAVEEVRGSGARRVVGLGDRARGKAVGTDACIEITSCLDDLIVALSGTRRSAPAASPTPRHDAGTVDLTRREKEVLGELLAGGNSTVIAGRLGISPQTFRTHVQNVLAKLGLSSRAQAVAWAIRNGIAPMHSERRAS